MSAQIRRVAVVTTSYPRWEGDPSGHFVQTEVQSLERSGLDVRVFSPTSHLFEFPGIAANLRSEPLRALECAKNLARVQRHLRHQGPFDQIIAHWAVPNAFLALEIAGEMEIVSHGADVRWLLRTPHWLRTPLVRRLATRATSWRFVSEELRAALLQCLPAALAKRLEAISTVRPSPISLDVDRKRVETLRSEFGSRLLVSVGRLIASKRVDRAVSYVARLDRPSTLVVIGEGPEQPRLARLARSRGIEVRFLGLLPRHETLAWIAAADELLFASRAEGLSTVCREAEALGTRLRLL